MESNLLEIEQIIRDGGITEAHTMLEIFLRDNPDNAEAWYLMGGILRRQELWGEAINAYSKAKFLNPAGPADGAIESIYEILRFVNTDLMNP